MLDNQVIDMSYWKFKELLAERDYPLCYVEDTKSFSVLMYERHRGYRCKIIKDGYGSSFNTELTDAQITDIYNDFIATGGIKEQAKLVDDIMNEAAAGINISSYKYKANTEKVKNLTEGVTTDITFQGKCKSIWFVSDKDINFQLDNGDVFYVHHGTEHELQFDYKLVNPVFNFTSLNGDGWVKYYIDGEVL